MKRSNKILLITGIITIVLLLVLGVAIRTSVRPSTQIINTPKTQSTFVEVAQINTGNHPNRTKTFKFDNFDTIYAKGIYTLKVKYAKNYSVQITAPKYLFNKITFKQTGKTIYLSGIDNNKAPFSTVITTPNLKEVNLKGIATFKFSGFDINNLKINSKGIISIEGYENKIKNLILNAKGATNTDLINSKVFNAKINLAGASSAKLNMSGGALIGKTKGMISITYSGKVSSQTIDRHGMTSIRKE